MRACPLHDLHSTAGNEPIGLARSPKIAIQVDRCTFGWVDTVRHVDTPNSRAIEHSKEVHLPRGVHRFVVDPHVRTNHVHVTMKLENLLWRIDERDELRLDLWHVISMARRDSVRP